MEPTYTVMLKVRKRGETVFMCCPVAVGQTKDEAIATLNAGGMQTLPGAEVTASLLPPIASSYPCLKLSVKDGEWVFA